MVCCIEVVLVRMASDRAKLPADQFRYRNAFHGLYRILKDEGVLALYRGWQPNVVRPPSFILISRSRADDTSDVAIGLGGFFGCKLDFWMVRSEPS